ncbi:trp operon leader peptide [Streptomyces xantholiticus]|uniref:Trp operon leader peptide n=1 Tax=Streptomyces xantholiticus TaxID=68285 RepID=A0ABV1UZ45_9ACTN
MVGGMLAQQAQSWWWTAHSAAH